MDYFANALSSIFEALSLVDRPNAPDSLQMKDPTLDPQRLATSADPSVFGRRHHAVEMSCVTRVPVSTQYRGHPIGHVERDSRSLSIGQQRNLIETGEATPMSLTEMPRESSSISTLVSESDGALPAAPKLVPRSIYPSLPPPPSSFHAEDDRRNTGNVNRQIRGNDVYNSKHEARGKAEKLSPRCSPVDDAEGDGMFDRTMTIETALSKLGLPDEDSPLPGMTIPLFKHQLFGVAWMYEQERSKNLGGILADDMGVGKTHQLLATMLLNRSSDALVKGTLIIMPLPALDGWEETIETSFIRNLFSVHVFHGPKKARTLEELCSYDIVLTTYGTLIQQLPSLEEKERHTGISTPSPISPTKARNEPGLLLQNSWYRVALDEGHIIRNCATKTFQAVFLLRSEYRWILTGTPIINGLADAGSYFIVLRLEPWNDPDYFYMMFVENERKSPTLCSLRLRAVLAYEMIRRSKTSTIDGKRIVDLPDKNVVCVRLELSPVERGIYDAVQKGALMALNSFFGRGTTFKPYSSVHPFVRLLRLCQVVVHPSLLIHHDKAKEIAQDVRLALDLMPYLRGQAEKENAGPLLSHLLANDRTSGSTCILCNSHVEGAPKHSCLHVECRDCTIKTAGRGSTDGSKKCCICAKPVVEALLDLANDFDQDFEVSDDVSNELMVDTGDEGEAAVIKAAERWHARLGDVPEFRTSTKMLQMTKLLKEFAWKFPTDKTIVFSKWTSCLQLAAECLTQQNIKYTRYQGDMTRRQRQDVLQEFKKDGGPQVLLMSLLAGGYALNLNCANRVIMLDLAWSEAVEEQAFDRVHRVGQNKEVFIYRLIVNNSIEERILEIQARKKMLSDYSLGEGESKRFGRMNRSDLAYLFGVSDFPR